MRKNNFESIDIEKLADLSVLKERVIYSDDFEKLNKQDQETVYGYCKQHANLPACKENLKQIRYAVSKIYFGY
ncbi:hypothetical protein [uncultured Ruminococcus sp.]|uniref:hypothetical protein n=1 Tax=uncultured Ruminococcus sp. TaxID=165186 RepID=UPI0025D05DD6|nr:hypothetical protein [uncultured Ruminococcus sp.]